MQQNMCAQRRMCHKQDVKDCQDIKAKTTKISKVQAEFNGM